MLKREIKCLWKWREVSNLKNTRILSYIGFGFVLIVFFTMIYLDWKANAFKPATYFTGVVAIVSLGISLINFVKKEEEKEAKVLVEVSEYYGFGNNTKPNHHFSIRNNSGFPLFNISVKFSKDIFFDKKSLVEELDGLTLDIGKNIEYVIEPSFIAKNDKISYTLIYYDGSGKRKKVKGKVVNRL